MVDAVPAFFVSPVKVATTAPSTRAVTTPTVSLTVADSSR